MFLSLSGSGTGLKLNNLISLCRGRQDTGNKGLLFLKPAQHFVIYRIMTSNSMEIALLSRRRLDEERRGFTAVTLCPGILEMKSILQYNWLNETCVVKKTKRPLNCQALPEDVVCIVMYIAQPLNNTRCMTWEVFVYFRHKREWKQCPHFFNDHRGVQHLCGEEQNKRFTFLPKTCSE